MSPAARNTQPLRPNDPPTIGGHRITGVIGQGGQGVVYLGTAPGGGRVAVKVLHARFGAGDRDRLLREADLARSVAAFCTARVLDAGVWQGQAYVVSEFVDGGSLEELVLAEGPRDEGGLTRLAIATLTALSAIHEAGIVHRDLKPANILLGPEGPVVIDFGIAKVVDASSARTSAPIGTPAFMAPEQIAGTRVGPPADIFSWAVTMAYAATGRMVFGGDSVPAILNRITHHEPDLTGVPDFLRPVLTRCLAKDPAERPAIPDLVSALTRNATASSARAGAAAPSAYPGRTLRVTRKSPFLHRVHWSPRARWWVTAGIVATGGAITVFAAAALVPQDSVPEPDGMPAAVQVQPSVASTPTVLSLPVSSPTPSPSKPASPPPSPSVPEDDPAEDDPAEDDPAEDDPAEDDERTEDEQGDDEQTDDVRAEEMSPTWSLAAAGGPFALTGARGAGDLAVVEIGGAQRVVSGGPDGKVWLSALTGEKSSRRLLGTMDSLVDHVAATMAGGHPYVAAASSLGTVRVWDAATGAVLVPKVTTGWTGRIHALTLGTYHGRPVVAFAHDSAGVVVGDVRARSLIGRPLLAKGSPFLDSQVNDLALGHVDGRDVVVAGARDGRVRVFDVATGKRVGKAVDHDTEGNGVEISVVTTGSGSGRQLLASGDTGGAVRISDLATGKRVSSFCESRFAGRQVNDLAFATVGGRDVLLVSAGENLRLCDLKSGQLTELEVPGSDPGHGVMRIALGHLGKRSALVIGRDDGKIRTALWQPPTKRQ
ncbi:WD40 repeat domain-containing serine/threonine protein kinase [Microbispora sp. ZYX-F-249]|uniref:non-specific serine/threonine protein kinase n=1 Tax=Microbispora maris TaxID=3144104 RepID=A0ABV0B324_9ACTN